MELLNLGVVLGTPLNLQLVPEMRVVSCGNCSVNLGSLANSSDFLYTSPAELHVHCDPHPPKSERPGGRGRELLPAPNGVLSRYNLMDASVYTSVKWDAQCLPLQVVTHSRYHSQGAGAQDSTPQPKHCARSALPPGGLRSSWG